MTMGRCSMDERLEYAAEYGKFYCYLSVWNKTILEWEKNGLSIERQYPTKKRGQFYCKISWEHAKPIPGEPLTQASRLWKISAEALSRDLSS